MWTFIIALVLGFSLTVHEAKTICLSQKDTAWSITEGCEYK